MLENVTYIKNLLDKCYLEKRLQKKVLRFLPHRTDILLVHACWHILVKTFCRKTVLMTPFIFIHIHFKCHFCEYTLF